jgi:hypothetical protein
MAVNLSPVGGVAAQFFDNDGNVLSGGKIYTYTAGSSTPAVTYTTAAGVIQHSNPIILNSAGRVPTGEIWLTDGITYKFVINNANDVLIGTYDNIVGINSNFLNFLAEQEIQTATANQTVFTLTTTQYQPNTNTLSVFVDGVNQYGPGAQYSYIETSSTVITFNNGLHVGASVKFTTTQALGGGTTSSALVIYQPAGTGAVTTTVQAKLRQWVSVIDYGADPTGVIESTTAFTNAMTASSLVYVPSGTYLIDQINITQDGMNLFTAGMSVTIQQKNVASRYDQPIINIKASNVSLGDMTFIGNIATDTGEFNHCIQIYDNSGLLSEIRNITLGNYYATNIRGDVLYVGGLTATPIYNVNVISLDGDNIYRSICSVTGGHGVRIQQILGNRVGYRNIDFESNVGSQSTDDCWVGYIRGGCVQLASDDANTRVGSIQIDQMDLDTAFMPAPTPYGVFTNPAGPDIAVLCSRFNFFKIGSLKINGFGAIGINLTNLVGEAKGRLMIDYLEATNIAPSGIYQTVIESSGASLVEINSGKVTLTAGSALLKGIDADYTLRNIQFVGNTTANLASYCTDLYCENLIGSFGSAALFTYVTNGQVINSRLTTTSSAMTQCADMSWYNCVLTAVDFDLSPAAGSNRATFDRGTFNGTWYDNYAHVPGGSDFGNFVGVLQGTGSPEGVVYANIGVLYVNLSGGAGTTLYVKQANNAAPTGWVGK